MAMNPISRTYAASSTGSQDAISVDWRDAPSGFAYQVVFDAGASGSVTVDTTLDNVNDVLNSITPVWIASSAITGTTSGSIGSPVQFFRLTIGSLSGGTITLKILEGAPNSVGTGGSGGGGGGAVTIADGADVAEGSTTDAAAAAGGTGTVSAKLRRISAQLPSALGQTTMSASQPVVIASNQSAISVQTPVPASIVTGQYKITASAVAIASSTALVNGVVVKAKLTNAGNVWIGSSGVTITDDGTGNGYRLAPGEACSFACSNVNLIYAIGTANDVIYFEGN